MSTCSIPIPPVMFGDREQARCEQKPWLQGQLFQLSLLLAVFGACSALSPVVDDKTTTQA